MAEEEPEPAHRPSWARRHWRLLAALGGVLVLAYVVAAATVLPAWIVSLSAGPKVDDNTRLTAVTNTRGTLLGLLAPLAVVVGGVAALLNYRAATEQSRRTLDQNRAVLDLQSRGQVTERFTRAIDQLGQRGDDKREVRIGAIYALEQIALDSAELHWPIMEVLTAYLREHAPARRSAEVPADAPRKAPLADHQAIATVIGRRRCSQDPTDQYLDLREVDLRHVQWGLAQLKGADLFGTCLQEAMLVGAELQGASLVSAHLEGVDLADAELQGAFLVGTCLERASLTWARLEGADLHQAHLGGTLLRGAHLERADLRKAKGLTWEQLQSAASLDGARLPAELAARLAELGGSPSSGPPEPMPEALAGTDS